jgi:hypothetical protein
MQHKFVQIREVTWKPTLIILGVAATLCCTQARAAIVYQNDFETPATAFSGLAASGTLAVLSTASLPTDSGGLASANHSTWLGRLGLGVAKSNTTSEIVMLSLTGLVPSTQYSVSFDLFIGGSWDGSAFSFGPDEWSLTAAIQPRIIKGT